MMLGLHAMQSMLSVAGLGSSGRGCLPSALSLALYCTCFETVLYPVGISWHTHCLVALNEGQHAMFLLS